MALHNASTTITNSEQLPESTKGVALSDSISQPEYLSAKRVALIMASIYITMFLIAIVRPRCILRT